VEDYRAQYDKPLISAGTQFAALPPAVQNTIRAEVGSSDIADIVKDTSLGHVIYRVSFENSDLFPRLNIAADGSLLDPDLVVAMGAPKDPANILTGGGSNGTSLNDLPPAAVKAIQRNASDAQVDSVIRQVSGGQVIYLVTFKDTAHPPVQVAADGSIISQAAK